MGSDRSGMVGVLRKNIGSPLSHAGFVVRGWDLGTNDYTASVEVRWSPQLMRWIVEAFHVPDDMLPLERRPGEGDAAFLERVRRGWPEAPS